jgi:hypothetical protein
MYIVMSHPLQIYASTVCDIYYRSTLSIPRWLQDVPQDPTTRTNSSIQEVHCTLILMFHSLLNICWN